MHNNIYCTYKVGPTCSRVCIVQTSFDSLRLQRSDIGEGRNTSTIIMLELK